jgi:multicomponent Na+:H+ antiporter subunit B
MIAGLPYVDLIGIALLVLVLLVALGIVLTRNLFAAVMLLGIFSLLMASTFFLLDAADVALTEAAVGAGVSTVLLLGTLALTADKEKPGGIPVLLPLMVVSLATAVLLYATFDKPALGDPDAPVQTHVTPRYLEQGPTEVGVPNLVTAVLASYRGYDTLGEVAVVFTAGIGVLLILGGGPRRGRYVSTISAEAIRGIKHHLVPRVVSKLLIPFIVLFALYVQFHGDYSPGGGFQAGAIFAAAIMLYALVQGDDAARKALPEKAMAFLASVGLLLYAGVGYVAMARGGNFLDYSVLSDDALAGQHIGIILIELGVGMTVAAILVSIFYSFAGRERR